MRVGWRARRVAIAAALLVTAAVVLDGGPAATAAACGNWTRVRSPNRGADTNIVPLDAVAMIGTNDVWAGGSYRTATGGLKTLTMHWDGASWTTVASPSHGRLSRVTDIAAFAPDDVWAVGGGDGAALALHWDGTVWSRAVTPAAAELWSVDGVASDDLWAVGDFGAALHWTGSGWTAVATPVVGDATYLYGVAAIAADNVWAVGAYEVGGYSYALAMRWNGRSWKVADAGLPAWITLQAVDGTGPRNVFAVGNTQIERWNGSSWVSVPHADPPSYHELQDVAALSSTRTLAAGIAYSATGVGTLIERRTGDAWTRDATPNPGASANELFAVSALATGEAWSVGGYYDGTTWRTLTLHYCPA